MLRRILSIILLLSVFVSGVPVRAQGLAPAAGPVLLEGVRFDPRQPLRFDFIVDPGTGRSPADVEQASGKLIRYFLAALATPDTDLWVNLSPDEPDRIVPALFGQTEMGRDLLAQDHILKQLTSRFIDPESPRGKVFWEKVYAAVAAKYGALDIPVDALNRVWIVPERVAVYAKVRADGSAGAFVNKAQLKVMLETDYQGLTRRDGAAAGKADPSADIARGVMREVIVPLLQQEVDEGAAFAPLRQIFSSLAVATWYKRTMRSSLVDQVYADQKKVDGLKYRGADGVGEDRQTPDQIWAAYVRSFRQGSFNGIREERDPLTQEIVPRQYFSGGIPLMIPDAAMIMVPALSSMLLRRYMRVTADLTPVPQRSSVENAAQSSRLETLQDELGREHFVYVDKNTVNIAAGRKLRAISDIFERHPEINTVVYWGDSFYTDRSYTGNDMSVLAAAEYWKKRGRNVICLSVDLDEEGHDPRALWVGTGVSGTAASVKIITEAFAAGQSRVLLPGQRADEGRSVDIPLDASTAYYFDKDDTLMWMGAGIPQNAELPGLFRALHAQAALTGVITGDDEESLKALSNYLFQTDALPAGFEPYVDEGMFRITSSQDGRGRAPVAKPFSREAIRRISSAVHAAGLEVFYETGYELFLVPLSGSAAQAVGGIDLNSAIGSWDISGNIAGRPVPGARSSLIRAQISGLRPVIVSSDPIYDLSQFLAVK